MKFLNIEGVKTLWSKIKEYIGTETRKYLPLSGGTMTGDIIYKSPNESVLCSIGTQGDVAHNNATGWIACDNIGGGARTIIQGSGLRAYAQNSSETAQPYQIEYFYDNIYIYFHPDSSTTRKYKFNLQKLINDGYLIEE